MKPQYDPQQGMLIEGNLWQIHPVTCESWTEKTAADFIADYQSQHPQQQLQQSKDAKALEIRQQTEDKIKGFDWQVQRAKDRITAAELRGESFADQLDAAESDLLEVLQKREIIRQQSDDAIMQLNQLDSIEAVESFQW